MKIVGSMEELQPLRIYCNCRQPSLPYICKKLIPQLQPMQTEHIMIEVVVVKATISPVINMVAIYKMKSFIFAADPIVS